MKLHFNLEREKISIENRHKIDWWHYQCDKANNFPMNVATCGYNFRNVSHCFYYLSIYRNNNNVHVRRIIKPSACICVWKLIFKWKWDSGENCERERIMLNWNWHINVKKVATCIIREMCRRRRDMLRQNCTIYNIHAVITFQYNFRGYK